MRSQASNSFRLIDRGFKDNILLIPGWATDWRIFSSLDLDFNYIMPVGFSPFTLKNDLINFLNKNAFDKVHIFGWSMGASLASDFIFEFPERVSDSVFMVSAKARYEEEMLENIRAYLKKSRASYLRKFYNECFSENEKEACSWFKKNLMKSYLEDMDLGWLYDGLEYLSGASLRYDGLEKLNVKFIHGQLDKIAPMGEAIEIKKNLPQSEFISMEGAGHMPFLNPNFRDCFAPSGLAMTVRQQYVGNV